MQTEIQIGNKKVGGNNPPFVIAELSCNHLQDFDLAVKTIHAMKESGADAVKSQVYTPDTITINSDKPDFQIKQGTIWDGQTLHGLYQKAYTPWDWFPKLKKLANDLGMEFFASAFDKTAVELLEEINVPAYKVASFEITDIPLIKHMASKGKPMIISTGIARKEDIEKAINACKSAGNEQIVLLKCTSAYPAPFEEANLRTIPDLAERFGVLSGLSDHTLGISASVAATALGATVIEKHFILDRKMGGPDAPFSLEPEEFKSMVESVHNARKALGTVNYELTEKAKKGREFSRSLYVVKDMKAGEEFTEENVKSIRPGFGMHPENLDKILGKKASCDIEKGERMSWDFVQ